MHILSIHTPPSSQLPGSNLEVLSACSSHNARSYQVGYDDGKLVIHWTRSSPAPDAVLELLACKRVRSCELPKCTCMSNGLACTEMCKLQSWNNHKQQENEDHSVEPGDPDDAIEEQVDV